MKTYIFLKAPHEAFIASKRVICILNLKEIYKETINFFSLCPKKRYFRRKIQLTTSGLNRSNEYFFGKLPTKPLLHQSWPYVYSIWRKFYKGTKNLFSLCPKKLYFRRKIQLTTSGLNWSNEYFFEKPPIASKWVICILNLK